MAKKYVCEQCGTVGKAKRMTRGSIILELVLWLMLIVPGLIYSVWRATTRYNACRACGSQALIPEGTPRANALLSTGGLQPQGAQTGVQQ